MYCDEIDIFNLDIGQFKLICEKRMTVRPLYLHTILFENLSHTYIINNNQQKHKQTMVYLEKDYL